MCTCTYFLWLSLIHMVFVHMWITVISPDRDFFVAMYAFIWCYINNAGHEIRDAYWHSFSTSKVDFAIKVRELVLNKQTIIDILLALLHYLQDCPVTLVYRIKAVASA